MIPRMNIVAWSAHAPWGELRQVEQDLIVSRALVSLFGDPVSSGELRFRGGTALNKLHFPKPLRYSEDIDLVRTTAGPIGPLLDRIRSVLEPWLGQATSELSAVAPKLRFRTEAEDGSADIKLKVEINTREREAYDKPKKIGLAVVNPWFTGSADIATYSREELLATKMRALLQRNKGRDLFDLAMALDVFPNLDTARIVEYLGLYLKKSNLSIRRDEAEQRMFAKLAAPRYLADMRPLLTADAAAELTDGAMRAAFMRVFTKLIIVMPGKPWAKTPEKLQRFGFDLGNITNR